MNTALSTGAPLRKTDASSLLGDAWQQLAIELQLAQMPSFSRNDLAERSQKDPPIIVVGAGPAAQACVRQLSSALPSDAWILLLNGEHFLPYNRAQLSTVLAAGPSLANLHATAFNERVNALHGVWVRAIERKSKYVECHNGERFFYRKLVLATGSRSRRPPLTGLQGDRVFDFRQLDDVQNLARLRPQKIAILGGGLLGIEAARALRTYCDDVVILERFPHLLPRQIDSEAGARLALHLTTLGITAQCDARLISAEIRDEAVLLRDESGVVQAFDAVVCATGISANIDIALQSGLECQQGIVVNEQQRSSDPDIYAVGECSELQGAIAGNLSVSLDQGRRAAQALLGANIAAPSSTELFQLKIDSCVVVAMGNHRAQNATQICYAPDHQHYIRVFIDQSRVVGAIVFAEAGFDFSHINEAINQRLLWNDDMQSRFLRDGSFPFISSANDNAIICFCTGVTVTQLRQLQALGLSHEQIIAQTGVSQQCGSCAQRVLTQLTEKQTLVNSSNTPRSITWAISLSFAVIIIFSLSMQPPLADSWQSSWRIVDRLWRDGVWRQISGYSTLLFLLLSFWPAWRRRQQRQIKQRQSLTHLMLHTSLVCGLLLSFVLHTGLQRGHGLNAKLSLLFLVALVLGSLSAQAWRWAARSEQHRLWLQRLRALHWFLLLPLPALLLIHIVKAYYF